MSCCSTAIDISALGMSLKHHLLKLFSSHVLYFDIVQKFAPVKICASFFAKTKYIYLR